MKHPIVFSAILAMSLTLANSCALAPGRLTAALAPMNAASNDEIIVEPNQAVLNGRPLGYMKLQVKWPDANGRTVQAFPTSTKQFRLTITATDLPQPIVVTVNRPTNATSASVQITVPAGSGRTLKVEGLNDALKVVASATQADLVINPGDYTPVTMGLVNTVGGIAGTLVDQETGQAIAGAEVSVGTIVAVTDSAGSFELMDLDPGSQTLTFKKPGHSDATQTIAIVAGVKATAGTKGMLRNHWVELASGTSEKLYGLTVLSPTDLWIFGANQTLLHSKNGGSTWDRPALPGASGTVYSVQFANSTIGYACTETGLYRTSDAGTTWNQVGSEMPGRGLSVIDSDTVFVYRPGANTINTSYSTNGGANRSSVDVGYGPYGSSNLPYFLGRGYSAFAYGDYGHVIYKSTSGGSSWGAIDIDPLRWDPGAPQCINPIDDNEVYFAGYRQDGDDYRKVIGHSISGGADWSLVHTSTATSSANLGYRAVTKIGTTLCAVGAEGAIAMRYPGAPNWTEVPINSERPELIHLNAVGFADPTTGWAVGDNGKLVKY